MVDELREGVYRLRLRGVNAYLVEDDIPTLVDAGTPWDVTRLRDALADAGVAVSELGRVLLTHYDLDHVGTLAALAPDLKARVFLADPDRGYLVGDRHPPLTNHKGLLQRLIGWLVSRPAIEVEPVVDGQTLGSFTAYHTPGHTPGHTAYVSETHSTAMLGDLATGADDGLAASGWLLSYDTAAVQGSIDRLAGTAPPVEVVGVGHGEPLTAGGHEALAALGTGSAPD